MGLTLIEASKLAANQGEYLRAGVIRVFAEASPLLANMVFTTIQGNSLAYNLQGALPGIAFRGINESYTPSTGVINPQTEPLKVVGGELTVDTALVTSLGMNIRSVHENMKATAVAQKVSKTFIKGDAANDPREFDGLEKRLAGGVASATGPVLSNKTDADGGVLSIAKLDAAIDLCERPTHILMLKAVRRSMTAYLRSSPSIRTDRDEFGRQIYRYNDLPILIADDFGDTPCLDQLEAFTGGGASVGTSIYVLRLEEGYLNAIQNGPMAVTDLGILQATPAYGTRIEWLVGMVLMHPRAAIRLRDIKAGDAAA